MASDLESKFSDKYSKQISRMPAKDLAQLMAIAEELKQAILRNDEQKIKSLAQNKHILLSLLEYLILNMDKADIDASLITMLQKFLGISSEKDKKEKDEEELLEYEEMSEEQKQHIHRIMIYEIYKALNPNQIAGETALENFINNVRRHGIVEAMQHEGKEFAKNFNQKDLENIESHRFSFVDHLSKAGIKSGRER